MTEQEPLNSELIQVDLEIPKYKLLFAQGMAYLRMVENSADWRVNKYDSEIKLLQDQIALLQKNDSNNFLADNSEQARFHQSIAFRLKEKNDKTSQAKSGELAN